jgi:DeoR/GlpR family transcriptional regulator of sugar metabolism
LTALVAISAAHWALTNSIKMMKVLEERNSASVRYVVGGKYQARFGLDSGATGKKTS